MLSLSQFEEMSQLEIDKIDRKNLIDIRSVQIDTSQPSEIRMKRYLEQIKNPYCFLCGDTPVRIRFVSSNKTLAKSLGDYFIGLK